MRKMIHSGIKWIGAIPEMWAISRIKYVADFEPKCDFSSLSPDSLITYTPMENIKNGYFIPNVAALGTLSTSLTAYQDNDIVMAKVTPCFENGNIAVMSGLSSGVGLGSSELFVFRAKEMQTRYLFYWLQNKAFVEQAKSTMTGTGGLKRVSPQFVRDCIIHCPPPDEQARIAAFLDVKCARINTVIEQTRASIEEYKKLKQSVIIQAVTGEQSLVALRYQPLWKAQSGGNGRGRKMHGVNGEDCIIKVPIGTLVFDAATGSLDRQVVGRDVPVL